MKNIVINRQDERYVKNDREIRKALLRALENRSLNLKPNDICKQATITRPTFYSHCDNVDDALKKYEDELESGFAKRLPHSGRKTVVFTIMLSFINDEKEYFRATLLSSDSYLLSSMFGKLKPRLGYKNTTEKYYEIYMQQQIALIGCWGKFEDFERQRIPFYADKLTKTEIQNKNLE